MGHQRLAISIVAVLVAVILGGFFGVRVWTQMHPCDVPNLPIPDRGSLSCHAETHLNYPGSQLVETGGFNEESRGFEQPQAATYDSYWGLNGSDQLQVQMWFEDELANRGWSSGPSFAAASFDWSRGREHFVLFLLSPQSDLVKSDSKLQGFRLPYQTRYYIDPFGPTSWLF